MNELEASAEDAGSVEKPSARRVPHGGAHQPIKPEQEHPTNSEEHSTHPTHIAANSEETTEAGNQAVPEDQPESEHPHHETTTEAAVRSVDTTDDQDLGSLVPAAPHRNDEQVREGEDDEEVDDRDEGESDGEDEIELTPLREVDPSEERDGEDEADEGDAEDDSDDVPEPIEDSSEGVLVEVDSSEEESRDGEVDPTEEESRDGEVDRDDHDEAEVEEEARAVVTPPQPYPLP